jgi:hypothetical protein
VVRPALSIVEGALLSHKSLGAARAVSVACASERHKREAKPKEHPKSRVLTAEAVRTTGFPHRVLSHTPCFPAHMTYRAELRYLSWFQTHAARPRKCKYSPCSRENTYAARNHIHYRRRRAHFLGGSRRGCRGIHLRPNLPHVLYSTQNITRGSDFGEMDCSTSKSKSGTVAPIVETELSKEDLCCFSSTCCSGAESG